MHRSEENKLIHVSFDLVKEFIPRVPKQRCPEEDGTIPRICVSPSLEKCLQAVPQAGEVLHQMKELGLPLIIHGYYMECKHPLYDVSKYVGDAEATGEMWILDKPDKIRRIDYEVIFDDFLWYTDAYGAKQRFPVGMKFKRVKYQDNMMNFLDMIFDENERKSEFVRQFPQLTFRQLMWNWKNIKRGMEKRWEERDGQRKTLNALKF